jgi:hypothetical protein
MIYEGGRSYDVISAGYKSFEDLAKDLKDFQSKASILINKISTDIGNLKNKLLNYNYHSKWSSKNDNIAKYKIQKLEEKKKNWIDKLNKLNDSSNYSNLKKWIKEVEIEL